MLAATYSLFQTIVTFTAISLVEFALFFTMVFIATRRSLSELFQSFYKTYLESLAFVTIILGILLFLKLKSGSGSLASTVVLFEQIYALMLFLTLVFTCSMHYPEFARNKYRHAFFGLLCLLIFLLFYIF